MTSVPIPTFAQPDPPAVSPHAERAEAHVHAFGERIGLTGTPDGRRRLDAGYGRFVAWTYPAADYADLCICAEWLFVTFVLDDLHTLSRYDSPEAWAPVHSRLQAIIDSGKEPSTERSTPFTQAIADLSRLTRDQVSPAFYQRFTQHLNLFFQGFGKESENRLRGVTPGLEDFTEVRRLSVGMEFGFDLVEFSLRTEIPEAVHATPAYRRLVTSATDIVAWQNDMHSLDLDTRRGDVHNLVIVLQRATGADWDTARDLAATKIKGRLADFAAAERELPAVLAEMGMSAAERAGILRSVAGMRQWTNGCLEWYRRTTRYAIAPATSDQDRQHAYLQDLL